MSIDFVDTQRFGGRQERKIDTHTEPQKKESALYMGCILGPAGPRCVFFGRICDQSRKEYGGMTQQLTVTVLPEVVGDI